jgi:hypothetical protein
MVMIRGNNNNNNNNDKNVLFTLLFCTLMQCPFRISFNQAHHFWVLLLYVYFVVTSADFLVLFLFYLIGWKIGFIVLYVCVRFNK